MQKTLQRIFRLFLAAACLLAASAHAQTYAYRSDTFSWAAPSGTATTVTWDNTCTSYPNGDDVRAEVNFPGGFVFPFAGTNYAQVRIMSNGIIQFGADAGFHRDYTSQTLPITAAAGGGGGGCPNSVPQNLLLVYWLDINTAPNIAGALVQYEMLGTAPNRRFVITWNNVALYGNPATRYSFQAILNENGTFKYQYTTGSSTGTGAAVGVQVTTTDYSLYAFNQNFIDTTNGTAILWYRADQAQPKDAEYFFNEATWAPSPATDVKDSSGNSLNGTRIGNAQSSNVHFQACRSALIPNNTTDIAQDAVSLPWTPGPVGSVSFWYRPSANTDAMLLDASTVANRPFLLMKVGQRLRLVVTDTAGASVVATTTTDNIPQNNWRHIAASWYMQSGTNQTVLRIYVNGVLQNVWRGTTNGTPGSVTNAYLGDNRTSGVTPNNGTARSANGYIDNLKIYPYDMSNVQAVADMVVVPGCASLDHFDVTVSPVSALTCEWVNVTITARDNIGGAVLTSVTTALSSSTGHGDWRVGTATGVFAPGASGSGNATYTFNNESSTTLQFNTRWAESVSLVANAGGILGSSTPVPFSHEGFKFVTASMAEAVVSKKVACLASNTAAAGSPGQAAQTLFLQAWKSDQSTFTCNTATQDFRNGQSANIGFSLQCSNPTTCVSGQVATVNGTNIGLSPATPATPGTTTYTNVSLTFDAQAKAPVVFSYTDVGQVKLWASYNPAGAGALPPNHMNGVSNIFTVAPASFRINTVTSSGGTPNPIGWPSAATPALATAAFTHASDPLSVTLEAMNACATPARTPNFGNELTAPTNTRHGGGTFATSIAGGNAVPVVSVPAPVLVTQPVFTSGTTSTAAVLRWDEVGAFRPTVSLSDYFGAGTVSGTSDWVGRLYPHHFDTVLTPAAGCAGFAYSGVPGQRGQPFAVQVTAKNGLAPVAGTTQNYNYSATPGLSFARAVDLSEDSAPAVAGSIYVGAAAGGAGAVPDTVFVSGVGTVPATAVANPSPVSFTYAGRPAEPQTITLHAEDADTLPSKATNGGVSGTMLVYSGRLMLGNAFGAEFVPLPIPLQTQRWQAGAWQMNGFDNCTTLTQPTRQDTGNGGLQFYSPPPSARNALEPGEVIAQMNGSTAASVVVTNGDARLVLRGATPAVGPGGGNQGFVDVIGANLGSPVWLPPTGNARACFGICGPRSPVIYSRERY
jgi:MSHA biogenesis protein MshQ